MPSDGDNVMVILSSPSGVGKTTLVKKIQQKYSSFKISVSMTTRSPRSNEVDGLTIYLHHIKNSRIFYIKKKNFMNMQKFLKIIMEL